jgi:hypothetical protein
MLSPDKARAQGCQVHADEDAEGNEQENRQPQGRQRRGGMVQNGGFAKPFAAFLPIKRGRHISHVQVSCPIRQKPSCPLQLSQSNIAAVRQPDEKLYISER